MAGKQPPDTPRRSSGTLPRGLMWLLAGAVVVVVGWQVLHGVFVKSINGPGGASLTFYPQHAASAGQYVGNTIKQGGGGGNRANVVGSDNHVDQSGTGNTATIGGLPSDGGMRPDAPPADGGDGGVGGTAGAGPGDATRGNADAPDQASPPR